MDRRKTPGEELLTVPIYKAVRREERTKSEDGENGKEYALIILPPNGRGGTNPEIESYPGDYLKRIHKADRSGEQ